jgi:hypothetical protein
MHVDVSCRHCGQRRRLDCGEPDARGLEEFKHLLVERLSHQPSFACFGGHFELRPPLPGFWEIHWETLGP